MTERQDELQGVRPHLQTERLWLRPFRDSDAGDVQRMVNCRELAMMTRNIDYPYPDGLAAAWIAKHASFWDSGAAVIFAIALRPDDILVGAIGLEINAADHRAELGYWIGKEHWNQGYASEAVKAVIDFGFEQLGLNRIFAHHMPHNPASGRVMQKCGMRHEGTLRQNLRKWGRYYDETVYGILHSEWERD